MLYSVGLMKEKRGGLQLVVGDSDALGTDTVYTRAPHHTLFTWCLNISFCISVGDDGDRECVVGAALF